MCGIAGIYSRSLSAPADSGELRAMSDALSARGPDGQGEWFAADRRVALAHRRLAIIDLSPAGAQPMLSADGSAAIVFNGEIYNWRELRSDLEARGETFRSQSDTEVLLRLYAREGEAMLGRLRGMFAFALWDLRKQAMLLARDPFGIKPLYWSERDGVLRFASQVKALLATRRIDTSPQAAGHAGFYLWGSVPAPWTLYKGVHALEAGHMLWVDSRGAAAPRAYCRIEDVLAEAAASPARGSRADALDAIADAVNDSVEAHLVADVPVGIFQSAGLDSCLISGIAAREGPVRTVTLGFAEYRGKAEDEVPLAERWARQIGTSHQTAWVNRRHFERDAGNFLRQMDQPSVDGANTWFVAKAAREAGLKVALSGLGGDELFGTYPSFRQLPRIRSAVRPFSRFPHLGAALRRASAPLLGRITSPKYAGLVEYGGDFAGAYLLRRALHMPWELQGLMPPELARQGLEELRVLERLSATCAAIPHDRLAISALELCWYTRHQLLADADWASMAHSLEVRIPFLDVPLLRSIAPWLAAHPTITKREVAQRLIPDAPREIVDRPKTGFNVPVRDWLAHATHAPSARGLRGWARHVYGQATGTQPDASALRVALWSPGMAAPGGIQSYMWRIWETLCASGAVAQPPGGISLMDRQAALDAWPNRTGSRPRACASSKLRFVMDCIAGPSRTELAIVGHLHHAPVALVAKLLRRIDGYVVVLHGVEAWPRLRWHHRLALRQATAVVATTRFSASTCARSNGLDGSNFRVLPLCADPAPAPPDAAFALSGPFPILFVGRLAKAEQYKGLEALIEAHHELVRAGTLATLHVVGDGDDRERLEAIARQSGARDHVFFHGNVNDPQLQAAYASAKVFAMPSAKEGFGIVFLEAMRHGVPCIGGAHCGTPEVFRDGVEGFLVPHGDARALAARLAQLAGEPATHDRMGEAARARFGHDYTFPSFASRWEDVLQYRALPARAALVNP